MTTPQTRRETTRLRPEPTQAFAPSQPPRGASRALVLALPTTLAVVVGAFALLTEQAVLQRTFLVTAGGLLAWCAVLYVAASRAGRTLSLEVAPKKPHWVQAIAQSSLMLWWAWHAPLIMRLLPFVAAQLVFAYAVDCLTTLSRRDRYTLGFAPMPLILSTNLFLIFRPEWFYWQFAMILVGVLAKQFLHWTRDGRSTHIFNPSSFPLAVASIALILTGATATTFGVQIANTQFDTPHIYLAIFLVSLPGQMLFGVARMTLSAAVTMYLASLAYFAVTGTYFFYDSHIPAAVFLGMHLLFTDPATSPRSGSGRLAFGALYSLLTMALFVALEAAGVPSFYDKLLPVPMMNLLVRGIDRFAARHPMKWLDPSRLVHALSAGGTNAAYTALWAIVFTGMAAAQGVGDTHPGQYLPFWQDACSVGSVRACRYSAQLTVVYCQRGSGWACNEVGILQRRLGRGPEAQFRRACALGFEPGCRNLEVPANAPGSLESDRPHDRDLPILLAGTKPPLGERDPAKLNAIACTQGWPGACGWTTSGTR